MNQGKGMVNKYGKLSIHVIDCTVYPKRRTIPCGTYAGSHEWSRWVPGFAAIFPQG